VAVVSVEQRHYADGAAGPRCARHPAGRSRPHGAVARRPERRGGVASAPSRRGQGRRCRGSDPGA
jgi:hypothetical protein